MSGPKKPIPLAPAPARFSVAGGKPRGGEGGVESHDRLSTSSSDEDVQLVARTVAPRPDGLYAELSGPDDEEDEIDGEDLVGDEEVMDRDELIRTRIATSQDQMRGILSSLTSEQLQRYETFRRVGFPRPMIKKVYTAADYLKPLAHAKDL